MANTLKFGNGQWATKEGSTLAYNDENGNFKPLPFNFTRSTGATRVNKQGLIEVVSNNEPRIDFTNDSKGALLLEPSKSNLVTYSESLESGWISSGANPPVITASQFISPDGNQKASRLQIPSTNSISILQQTFSHISGTQYTVSAYVKSNVSTNQQFRLYGDFGSPTGISGVLIATSEWQRFTFTYTATGTGARSGGFYYVPNTESDIQIYGFQAEQGSYATSYIPTQGSVSTRDGDVCNGAGNEQVFNDSEGVLYAEVSTFADNTYKRISLNNGSYVNSVVFDFVDNNNLYGKIFVGGSPIATILASGLNIENNNKLALKYKQNDFALWVNGIQVGTDTSGSTPSGLNTLGLDLAGGQDFYGNCKDLRVYNEALTDAELQALTS